MANEPHEPEMETPENAVILDASTVGKIQNHFCPFCETERDIEFMGIVTELGSIPRFHSKMCLRIWESKFN